jgi:hypothetical protein
VIGSVPAVHVGSATAVPGVNATVAVVPIVTAVPASIAKAEAPRAMARRRETPRCRTFDRPIIEWPNVLTNSAFLDQRMLNRDSTPAAARDNGGENKGMQSLTILKNLWSG